MIRRITFSVILVLAALVGLLALNTLRQGSRQMQVGAFAQRPVDAPAVTARLSGAVQLRTISWDAPSAASRGELLKLRTYLEDAFPHVHAALRREVIDGYSLLFTWPGQDPAAQPILLMAHQDVVPVAPGTEAQWHEAPFSGEMRDGFVWGRGSWDDKGNLMAILEAAESLAAAGFKPRRTIYLAFGHDEESSGEGAQAIAKVLAERRVRCEFALDEGLLITEGIVPGLETSAALIGIAEKGSLALAVTANATPGHSSMPPPRSAIGALAWALVRIEASPMPAAIDGVAARMFETLAPEMHGLQRVALSNLWLFGPLVRAELEKAPATSAALRTTTAITVIHGGNKENVLPGRADALVNFRLLPGDTAAAVLDHVRSAVGDPAIRFEIVSSHEASPVASTASASYRLIERTVRELFPGVVVAPGLMIGSTDSRHMAGIADNIYRFSPVRAHSEDLSRFHGTDERIAIMNYVELIRFYDALIRHAAGGE
jgi:carboxypeptidase PM20D1